MEPTAGSGPRLCLDEGTTVRRTVGHRRPEGGRRSATAPTGSTSCAALDPDASLRHRGLTLLLVPVDQPGVQVRPIKNLAGSGEFAECFFTDARTDESMVVGEVNGGWRVVMSTLGYERGSALLPIQLAMEREVGVVVEAAKRNGAADDARLADRIAAATRRSRSCARHEYAGAGGRCGR